jgi:hypothetical protein
LSPFPPGAKALAEKRRKPGYGSSNLPGAIRDELKVLLMPLQTADEEKHELKSPRNV